MIRTYLEYVLELPWKKSTEDTLDIAHARQVLDEDHFGLKDVKEPHPGTSGRAEAQPEREGAHPVLRRTSRRGQNFAGPIHRASAWTASSSA